MFFFFNPNTTDCFTTAFSENLCCFAKFPNTHLNEMEEDGPRINDKKREKKWLKSRIKVKKKRISE